jgi:hypothetical protein
MSPAFAIRLDTTPARRPSRGDLPRQNREIAAGRAQVTADQKRPIAEIEQFRPPRDCKGGLSRPARSSEPDNQSGLSVSGRALVRRYTKVCRLVAFSNLEDSSSKVLLFQQRDHKAAESATCALPELPGGICHLMSRLAP